MRHLPHVRSGVQGHDIKNHLGLLLPFGCLNWLARMSTAASETVRSIRFRRVSGDLADPIHSRIARPVDRGKASRFSSAGYFLGAGMTPFFPKNESSEKLSTTQFRSAAEGQWVAVEARVEAKICHASKLLAMRDKVT